MLRNFRRNTSIWPLHCSLMVIYCSATVPLSTYSGASHMWTRRIVRSVSVKANFKNTSFLFFSRMDMLWLYAIKEFEGIGETSTRLGRVLDRVPDRVLDRVHGCFVSTSWPCSKSYRLANVLHCDGLGCVFGNHPGPLCEKVNHRIRVILISWFFHFHFELILKWLIVWRGTIFIKVNLY